MNTKKNEEIFNIIYSYLYEQEEIESNSEVISAYDLYNMVHEKFHELRRIKKSSLKESVNKGYSVLKEFSSVIKRESKSLNTRCKDVVIAGDKNMAKITFVFSRFASKKLNSISLLKDRKSGEIYYDENVEVTKRKQDLANNNFSEITKTFKTIEKLVDLSEAPLKSREDANTTQQFSDFLFDGCLTYDTYGKVNISLEIASDMGSYYFEENKERLNQIVENNKKELLKKIPINVSSLNNTCRMIVKENMESLKDKNILKEKHSIKTLQK